MTKFLLHLTERGYIPDFLIKRAALFLSNRRLAESDIEKNKEKLLTYYQMELSRKKQLMLMINIMKYLQNFLKKYLVID